MFYLIFTSELDYGKCRIKPILPTTVDPGSVMLEGLGVALRGKSDKLLASEEDGDGDNDLAVKIDTDNLDPGICQDGPVLLTGSTYDGQDIVGTDDIIIVPPEE